MYMYVHIYVFMGFFFVVFVFLFVWGFFGEPFERQILLLTAKYFCMHLLRLGIFFPMYPQYYIIPKKN